MTRPEAWAWYYWWLATLQRDVHLAPDEYYARTLAVATEAGERFPGEFDSAGSFSALLSSPIQLLRDHMAETCPDALVMLDGGNAETERTDRERHWQSPDGRARLNAARQEADRRLGPKR